MFFVTSSHHPHCFSEAVARRSGFTPFDRDFPLLLGAIGPRLARISRHLSGATDSYVWRNKI